MQNRQQMVDPVDVELIGREDAVDAIARALRSVAGGGSSGLRLAGEPGIGKSRLIAELAGRAHAAGFEVFAGRASEFERDAPFMAFVDALDDHLAGPGRAVIRSLPAGTTALLSAVFPAVAAPSGAPVRLVGAERFRIYRAVRSLLDELAKTSPIALVLDDLHWADDSSAELVAHLLTYPPRGRVLIATAYRPTQLGEQPRSAVERALREGWLTAIDLAPLSRAQARTLLGHGVTADALDALYTESGGNPFYLLELARDRRTPGGHGGWHDSGVPAAVVAAINREIAALPEAARVLAQGAAVAGETFTANAAATAADAHPADALFVVDRLVSDGLLVPSEIPRRFRFRHPVVRRTVYDSAGSGRRIVMHRRLAAALRARNASPVELAHHLEVAAEPGDEAATEALTAAGHALAGTAPAIAASRFAAALRLLPPGDGRRVELLIPLAAARRVSGELHASREALVEALSLVPGDAVAQQLRLTASCGAVETDLGLIAEAHTRLLRAWEAMSERSSTLAAELLVELAINAYHRSHWADELSYSRQALASARRLGARQIEAMALTMQATAEFGASRFEAAQSALDDAAQLVDDLTDQELAARLDVTVFLSDCEFLVERFDAAVRHADRGLALSRSTGQTQLFHDHLAARVCPLMMLGRLDEALESAQEAEASARLTGVGQVLLEALMCVVHAAIGVGDLPAAVAAGEEGLALARTLPPTQPAAVLGWGMAQALLESGELDRAALILFDLTWPATSAMGPNATHCVWELAARIEAERGRLEQAQRWVDRIDARLPQLAGLGFPRYWAERARTWVMLAQGDSKGAARAALDAVAAANPESRYEASQARLLAGRAFAAAGDRAAAVPLLRQARSEFEEYGAIRQRDQAVRELRRLGQRVGRGGRRASGTNGAMALSGREREISEMVADGHTNKEIGDALLISTRTVERHLSHVFDKLNVSSRAQLGAEIQRQEHTT